MSDEREDRIYRALMELASIDTHDVNLRDSGQAHTILEELLAKEDEIATQQHASEALISAWADAHKRPCPWKTAVEISSIVTKMSAEEKAALLALDDDATGALK